jgi:CheY-like chemotaxis protein
LFYLIAVTVFEDKIGMCIGVGSMELRILHVEDDAVEAMNLQRIFRKLGVKHQLASATNGEAALLHLRENPRVLPHIILLDLHMPFMNGLEFLQALRSDANLGHIAVYVLTSSVMPQDEFHARQYNIENFLVKPFTPDKYREVIVDLLAKWEDRIFEA